MSERLAPMLDRLASLTGLSSEIWSDLVRSSASAFGLKIAGAGLSFAFNVLLGRLLGADGSGLYFLALTVVSMASVVSRMGMDNALIRFTAEGASSGDWGSVETVHRKGVAISSAVGVGLALAVFLGAPWIATFVFGDPDLVVPLKVMAASIPAMALVKLYAGLLKGVEHVKSALLVETVGVPGVSAVLLLLLAPRFGPGGAAGAYAAASILTLAAGALVWRRATPHAGGAEGEFSTRRLLSASVPLLWVASLNLVINWTDTTVLGIWVEASEVGLYGVALRTATLTSFILVAVNSVVAPKFAALWSSGDRETLTSLARNATKLITVASAPVLLVFLAVPAWVLGWFGPEFPAASTLLVVLAIGQFVNSASGSVGYLLMMTGKERLVRNNVMLAAGLNLAGNLVLVPWLGALGAAIATAGSLAVKNLAAVRLVRNHLSILIWPRLQTR